LSKFFEAVDALTGDVAYRHTNGNERNLALVTAGHYHSRKLKGTDLNRDTLLRCYLTACGTTSLEVRTDALQLDPITGEEQLINVCHTTMVALDKNTMRPMKGGGAVPPLALENDLDFFPPKQLQQQQQLQGGGGAAAGGEGEGIAAAGDGGDVEGGGGWGGGGRFSLLTASERQLERSLLAEWHSLIRKERSASSMSTRGKRSVPPSPGEAAVLHDMFKRAVAEQVAFHKLGGWWWW
jgi:acyl-CoA hydrolase